MSNSITGINMDEEPPSSKSNLDTSPGDVPPSSPVAKRFEGFESIWRSLDGLCPVRGFVSSRRLLVPKDIQEVVSVSPR